MNRQTHKNYPKIIYHFQRLLAMGMTKDELKKWVRQVVDSSN